MNKLLRRYVVKKHFELEEEKNEIRFQRSEQGNLKYAEPGDTDLTPEQIKQIDEYWSRYSFAIKKVDYNAFKTYTNRSGIFDVRYIPHGIRARFLTEFITPPKYKTAFQNKAYISKIMKNVRQPKILVRKVEGIYYNEDFYRISAGEAVQLCLEKLKSGTEIVVKPSGMSGGKGVEFLSSSTEKELRSMFRRKGRLFVVQEAIKQHPEMGRLNESTVNTIRLTTMLYHQEIVPLAALIKVGAPNVRVDNFHFGGCLIPLNLDGTAYPWALSLKHEHVTVLPSGVDLSKETFKVPSFDRLLDMAATAHLEIPKIKMASWDICVDHEGNPTIIEANFSGDFRMHQAVTGPIFGEYTQEILDKYILGKHFYYRANYNFDYREYCDHVEIERYDGNSKKVKVPANIKGKPVTKIVAEAFGRLDNLREVVLPESIEAVGKRAFVACKNLEHVNLSDTVATSIGAEVFMLCPKLDKETKRAERAIKKGAAIKEPEEVEDQEEQTEER